MILDLKDGTLQDSGKEEGKTFHKLHALGMNGDLWDWLAIFFFFFYWVMLRKGHGDLYKAPTKEEVQVGKGASEFVYR